MKSADFAKYPDALADLDLAISVRRIMSETAESLLRRRWQNFLGHDQECRLGQGHLIVQIAKTIQAVGKAHPGLGRRLRRRAQGKASMEIGVRVDSEHPLTGERFHNVSAYLTFVAIGTDGKPRPVPPLLVETDIEKRRNRAAQQRRAARIKLAEEIKKDNDANS